MRLLEFGWDEACAMGRRCGKTAINLWLLQIWWDAYILDQIDYQGWPTRDGLGEEC